MELTSVGGPLFLRFNSSDINNDTIFRESLRTSLTRRFQPAGVSLSSHSRKSQTGTHEPLG